MSILNIFFWIIAIALFLWVLINRINKSDKENEKEKSSDDTKKSQPKRNPGQLSKEQIKSLLEAMNQQEKNVQDKVNAKKQKGIPIKKKKDW